MEVHNKWPKLMYHRNTCKHINFSTLSLKEKILSETFQVDDLEWYLVISRTGDTNDQFGHYHQFGLYLEVDRVNLPQDWKKIEAFSLAVVNQRDDNRTIRKGGEYEFSYGQPSFGFHSFTAFSHLNERNGFIVNDTLVIEAGFFVLKFVYDSIPYQPPNFDNVPPTSQHRAFFHRMFSASFPGISQDLVQLLEPVCLNHPLLFVSQEKRSAKHSENAFLALGRYLQLMSKHAISMNDEHWNHLDQLWEEANIYEFDLSFIRHNDEIVLDMKRQQQNMCEVIKAREKVNGLKKELEMAKEKVNRLEAEHETARGTLMETEKRLAEGRRHLRLRRKLNKGLAAELWQEGP